MYFISLSSMPIYVITSIIIFLVNSFPLKDNTNVNINANINFDNNLYYQYDIRDYDENEELIPCDNINSFYSDAFIIDYKILYSIITTKNITKQNTIIVTKNITKQNTIIVTNNDNNNNDNNNNKCVDYYNSLYDYLYYKNNVKLYFADDTRNIENSKFGLHNNIKCANIQKIYHGVIRLKYQTLSHCSYTCDMFVILNQQNITIINTYIKSYYNINKKLHLICNHTHCTHRKQFTCIANNDNKNDNKKNEL